VAKERGRGIGDRWHLYQGAARCEGGKPVLKRKLRDKLTSSERTGKVTGILKEQEERINLGRREPKNVEEGEGIEKSSAIKHRWS